MSIFNTHLTSTRTDEGLFIYNVLNESKEVLFSSEACHQPESAKNEAETWVHWANNAFEGKVESIYYIIQVPDTWPGPPPNGHPYSGLYVKIGRTNNVFKRLRNLQTGTFGKLIINALQPGDSKVEAKLHEKFKIDRRQGEWFVCSPQLFKHIMRTWYRYRILPREHQHLVMQLMEKSRIYGALRESLGHSPDMINPSINEDWHGFVLLDLVYSSLGDRLDEN